MSHFKSIRLSLIAFSIIVFSHFSYATTYYTISDGAWDNTQTVWSYNGNSPCLCAPPNKIDNVKVVIRDSITSVNSKLELEDSVIIDSLGYLNSSAKDIVIDEDGVLLAKRGSYLKMKKLTIKEEGKAFLLGGSFSGSKWKIQEDGLLEVKGTSIIDNGQLELKEDAKLKMRNRSIIKLLKKDIKNKGSIEMNNSFIIVKASKIDNESEGIISGTGGISAFDEVDNQGSWNSGVSWCSDGSSSGMSFPQDCSFRSGMLPIVLVDFVADIEESNKIVELKWVTALEVNNDFFTIERSSDGVDYESIGELKGKGTDIGENIYTFTDEAPLEGTAYYRLKQTDFDGKFEYHKVISIQREFQLFSENFLDVRFDRNQAFVRLKGNERLVEGECFVTVADMQGNTVIFDQYPPEFKRQYIDIEWPDQLPKGIYIIIFEQAGEQFRHIEKIFSN